MEKQQKKSDLSLFVWETFNKLSNYVEGIEKKLTVFFGKYKIEKIIATTFYWVLSEITVIHKHDGDSNKKSVYTVWYKSL